MLTHDASFNLYEDILLLAGREARTERWLLFTEPVPTLKEAQLDFLRFLLHGMGRREVGNEGWGGGESVTRTISVKKMLATTLSLWKHQTYCITIGSSTVLCVTKGI